MSYKIKSKGISEQDLYFDADFAEGYVKWDDEDSLNKNDWQGVLPDGVYDEDTLQRFCCR